MKIAIGDRFGKWTVVGDSNKTHHVLCRCECERTKEVNIYNLAAMRSTQCRSCQIASRNKKCSTTHGMSNSPEYKTWDGIVQRMTNPNNHAYSKYGARLDIDPDFLGEGGFDRWLKEVGPRPSMDHSIDRVDNELGYIRGNMRWATSTEQNRNTRNNVYYKGKCLKEWSEITGTTYKTLWVRYRKYGWPIHEAIFGRGAQPV